MKKLASIILVLAAIVCLFHINSFAQTIITCPIDSRPISTDYLGNLADISGDSFICVDKKNLDFYSAIDKNNYKGDSKKVRQELREIVGSNNTKDTTVILNTSTYLTNGLVSSRCGINYKDLDEGLDDLYSLIKEYPEPAYYINLAMPRTLPETRLNKIWKDDKKIEGLGYYYIKNNPNSPLREYILKNLRIVTPSQYLLECAYVENKKEELGMEALEKWETELLEGFYKDEKYFPYKADSYNYALPYKSVSTIFIKLLKWQDEGLIDEIIISNDDFQLPDSIIYMFNNGEKWIPTENEKPIKFSYARTYMTSGLLSLKKQLIIKRGEEEAKAALECRSKNVNFIFGMDEIPQLIYARDLSKRKNLTSNFNLIDCDSKNDIAKFDVIGVNDLLKNDVNFISGGKMKTDKKLDLYLYNYNNTSQEKVDKVDSQIKESIKSLNNASLIEIYSEQLLNTGENLLFKKLLEEKTITELAGYSAWNTNANAIGLGVAHSQVYGISEQTNEDLNEFKKAQIKMLLQHAIEDGVYTIQTKRALSNERYIPTQEDMEKSQKLLNTLNPNKIVDVFNEKNEEMKITLTKYNFPWARTFECFLEFEIKAKAS